MKDLEREEWRTPEGKRALFATTVFGLRQHLAVDGLFSQQTACGHPVDGSSTGPIRTRLGFTCWWGVRRVTRHGTASPAPLGWAWRGLELLLRRYPKLVDPLTRLLGGGDKS